MLKVNEKVVCINGNFHEESKKLIPNLPVENEIYTIRDSFRQKGEAVVLLNEITNPHLDISQDTTADGGYGFSFEPSFKASRFIPISDLELEEIYENSDEILASI